MAVSRGEEMVRTGGAGCPVPRARPRPPEGRIVADLRAGRPARAPGRAAPSGAEPAGPRPDRVADAPAAPGGSLPDAVAAELLDRLPQCLLVAGAQGRLVWANRAGGAVLRAADGLLVDRAGLLRCPFPEPSAALLVLIGRAARGSGGEARLARAAPRSALVILASPLPGGPAPAARPGAPDQEPRALLQVIDPERPGAPVPGPAVARRLRLLYGLTPAEAAVAARLGAGDGMQAAADALGITVETVRTHAKRAFDKTGVRRQTGLARLVERLAAEEPVP